MNERFFQSPQQIDIPDDMPLVFIEGPVQGAPDWQTPFAERLLAEVPGIAVASPRATAEQQDDFMSGNETRKKRAENRQVAYELLARRRAFQFGAIVIWYAAQDFTIPYDPKRRYAKTTHMEHGEVWGWLAAHPEYPLILGVDPEFKAGPDNNRNYFGGNDRLLDIPELISLDDVFNSTVAALGRLASEGRRPVPALTSQSRQRALDQLG